MFIHSLLPAFIRTRSLNPCNESPLWDLGIQSCTEHDPCPVGFRLSVESGKPKGGATWQTTQLGMGRGPPAAMTARSIPKALLH